MAAAGRSEDSEILCQHIDIVVSKMEQMMLLFSPGSDFIKCFDSGEGKSWAAYVQNYSASLTSKSDTPKAPSGSGMKSWLNTMYPRIKNIAASIKYIGQWATLSMYQIKMALGKIIELDIRWNQATTITLCKIFVQLVKVMLFFNQCPYVRHYALMVLNAPAKEFNNASGEFQKTVQLLNSCIINPFACLSTNIDPVKSKMARFASNVGTFMAKLFGVFPLIEWEPFSIFTKRTAQPESMLPADEFIILQNITLFKETLFFFLFTFPESTTSNECFSLIIEALLSEIPVIQVTRSLSIPLDDFLKICPNDVFNKTLLNAAILQTRRKFNTSHIQRIVRVTILLEDILNICKFNISLLPPLMNFITALGGLAYYELDTCFYFKEPRNEAMHLLSVCADLAELIRANFNYVQRFFFFNIAQTDTQYLAKQLSPAVVSTSATLKEVDVSKLVSDLLSSLLALDLDAYDKGSRYDFTALLVTHSHYLFKFAELKTRERVSFLDPIFEHLTVIRDHIAFATNPVQAFLRYCPLHTMWNHLNLFSSFVRGNDINIQYLPSLLKMFTFFSYDTGVLRQLGIECQNAVKKFGEIRGGIFIRMTSAISQKIDNHSPDFLISLQTHDFQQGNSAFQALEFALPRGQQKKRAMLKCAENIERTAVLASTFEGIPQTVILFKNQDLTAGYFANNITDNLTRYMFPSEGTPTFSHMDMAFSAAAQTIWPLFSAVSSSFQRRIFEYRLRESTYPNMHSFDTQIQSLLGLIPREESPLNTNTLVLRIERIFENFIKHNFKNAIYVPPFRGFWATDGNPFTASYFTERCLEYLIRNLGINIGFRINKLLTQTIVDTIALIFKLFCEVEPQVKHWRDEYKKSGGLRAEIVQNPILTTAAEQMIKLGGTLELRNLVRSAIKTSLDVNLPGLSTLLEAASYRKPQLDPREVLIREILCGDSAEIPFIRTKVQMLKFKTMKQCSTMYFFFAIMFLAPTFNGAKYDPAHGTITNNMHLIPKAIGAILRLADLMFDDLTDRNPQNEIRVNGLELMMATLRSAIGVKMASDPSCANAMTIMANLLPDAFPSIPFSLIEQYFPTRMINHAYSDAAGDMTNRRRRKEKKPKK